MSLNSVVIEIREINNPKKVIADKQISAFYSDNEKENCAMQLIDDFTTLQYKDCYAVEREVLRYKQNGQSVLGKNAIKKYFF